MFDSYYQAELSYLRDMGRTFAAQHPALAGMLAERGTDPDVERLLEGFAFVAGRLRQRIDDAAPELVEALAELLLPHALKPTPAATIVELRPTPRAVRGPVRVQRGTRLLSKALHGTRCTFTTAYELEVLPLRLASVRLDESAPSSPELVLRLEVEPGLHAVIARSSALRFHLHGELANTSQLYLWLARHLRGVTLRAADEAVSSRGPASAGVGAGVIELGARALRLPSFDAGEALLPWPAFAPESARLLLEYFALPEKFLFFELTQLEALAELAAGTFELALRFHRPPPLPSRLSDDVIRLHCVPVVNLFAVGAEPIRASLDERPTLLRAAGLDPSHMEVFSVESVSGVARGAERHAYPPFHELGRIRATARDAGYYKLSRRASPLDDGTHTFLSLQRPPTRALQTDQETLSIELLCTNRSLADALQVGDLATPTSDLPSGLTFSNIASVSSATRPPVGSELPWRFLSHLACTRRSLADRDALKTMLSLYVPGEQPDAPGARAKHAKVDAILSVQVETVTRVLGGVTARGSLYRIELASGSFTSEGDAYLFSALLHRVLALDAPINAFSDLRTRLTPSGLEWRFDAERSV